MADIIIKKRNEAFLTIQAEPHILHEISNYFSFEVPNAHFAKKHRKGWDGRIRLFNMRDNSIYAGLIFRICSWAEKSGYLYEFNDNEYYGMPFEEDDMVTRDGCLFFMQRLCKQFKPREYQIDAVYEALRYNRKTILSATASGKSFIIYTIVRYHVANDKKVLIIVPRVDLTNQLSNDFIEYGWSDEKIHKVSAGFEKDTDRPVTISTWQSIKEQSDSWYEQFDCVVVDEAHGAQSSEIKRIMTKCREAKFRYGFTGTLDNGSKTNATIIEGLFGPVYTAVGTREMIDGGNASDVLINIKVLKHEPTSIPDYHSEIEYLCKNEKRNSYLIDLVKNLPGNTVVLFDRIEEHCVPFYHAINEETKTPTYIVHGTIKKRDTIYDNIRKSSNNILVASYGCCSTGLNIPNIDNIVFASSGKSKIKVLQSIGRALRLAEGKSHANIYDIADSINNESNYTYVHLTERLKYYTTEELDYVIEEIDL